jgi:hypothetical protein
MNEASKKVCAIALVAIVLFAFGSAASATWFEESSVTCTHDQNKPHHANKVRGSYSNESRLGTWYAIAPSNSSFLHNNYWATSQQGVGTSLYHMRGSTGSFDLSGSYGYCKLLG